MLIFLYHVQLNNEKKAYKKDSDELALYGVEILILACHTLSINHVTNIFKFDFK